MSGQKPVPFSVAYQCDRIRLIDNIPLAAPLCVCIEPANLCNFKCLMCWQGTDEYKQNGGPFANMDMDLYRKVISDIEEFASLGHMVKLVKLYSTGEPLLNPYLGEMVKLLKTKDICQQVEVTTNASLMTEDLARTFVDYGLDYFRASIYSVKPEEHERVTQSKVLPQDILKKINFLRAYRDAQGKMKPYIHAKIMDRHDEENEMFKSMYENVADEQCIDIPWNVPKLAEKALDRLYGGVEKGEEAKQEYLDFAGYKNRKACRYPFTHMTVRSNGDVVVCCTDWSRDTKLGNVKEKSLKEIWESKELYNFRLMQIRTKGVNHPLCAGCVIPLKDSPEDNIDDLDISRIGYRE